MNVNGPLQSVIQRMGNNFLVATFIPSMAFVVISSIAFGCLLPPQLRLLVSEPTQLIESGFNLLLFTTILGFTLFSLSTYIYKTFEGYTFVLGMESALRRSFLQRQRRRFIKNENARVWVEKQLVRINRRIDREGEHKPTEWRLRRQNRYIQERELLYDRQYSLTSERNENFPPSLQLIMPTRFGNILRSAEMYPGKRYGIDAVPLWGRLIHVIPDDAMIKIDEANNQCLFLLNSALLAGIFTILCIMVAFFGGVHLWIKACGLSSSISCLVATLPNVFILYMILAIFAGCTAWLFYSASLINVSQYGNMIRASYDLYRFHLLNALHLAPPVSLKEEKILWRRISYFMVGNEQWDRLDIQETMERLSIEPNGGFEYVHKND